MRPDDDAPHAQATVHAVSPATLRALVIGQICLHAAMAGLRLAAPLMLLRQGPGPWGPAALGAGVLLGLFALAPALLVVPAGRWADRRGYHRPVRASIALVVAGGACAVVATWVQGWAQVGLLVATAVLAGTGCNVGLVTIQRSAGQLVPPPGEGGLSAGERNAQLRQVFSWLGLAPSLSNVIGPMLAGALIDLAGYGSAYAVMGLLPLATLWWSRRVPRERRNPVQQARDAAAPRLRPLALLRLPGIGRLLLLNWFFSTSWDLHAFVVPLLGHERGLSASAIGTVLGVFALAVAAVRALMPLLAVRLTERQVMVGAMLLAAAMFVLYPWAHSALAMGACAAMLGLALGSVQPMIMTTLHHLAPPAQQGEALALRAAMINLSSTVLPMVFGTLGAAVGPTLLFRGMSLVLVGALPLAARPPTAHEPAR